MRSAVFRVGAAGLVALLLAWVPGGFPGGVAAAEGAPRGVHLSFTQEPTTSMTVTWFTDGAQAPASRVEYGPTQALGLMVEASAHAAPNIEGVWVHEATLTGLGPGGAYSYRVGSDAGGFSDAFNFTTDDGDGTFRLVIFGDHGTEGRSQATTAMVVEEDPDLVVIVGDLSYADGEQAVWDVWFDQLEPLAASVPVMAAVGNHGYEGSTKGTAAFRERMALPGQELYYSFEYGRVHFTVVQSDDTAALQEGVLWEMLQWVEADLAAAQQRKQAGQIDLVAVVQHHPLYGNTNSGIPDNQIERQTYWPYILVEEHLLVRYDVDLLLTGHNHNYERSKPMLFGQPTTGETTDYVDPQGYVEIISGGAGKSLYAFLDPNDFGDWSAAWARRYHYAAFDVQPGRLDGRAVDTWDLPGALLDSWSLTVSPGGASKGVVGVGLGAPAWEPGAGAG